jgi:hypothetical protein
LTIKIVWNISLYIEIPLRTILLLHLTGDRESGVGHLKVPMGGGERGHYNHQNVLTRAKNRTFRLERKKK